MTFNSVRRALLSISRYHIIQ